MDFELNIYGLLMILTFVIGYIAIAMEHITRINKTSIALLMAIICWTLQFINQAKASENNLQYLSEHIGSISQVIFFLLGALTIVEIISVHKGFQIISNAIRINSKKKLLWSLGAIAFFLSSILDNLTTTIVMVTLLRKLTEPGEDRLVLGGAVVVAANAGGAWTPIGDVTTTMLWIGGQLTTFSVITSLFLPSLVCLLASLAALTITLKGNFLPTSFSREEEMEPMGTTVFWLGIGCLIFVPIFKVATGLPPFMGMIFGLGIMWLFTDIVHSRYEDREHLLVPSVMAKIDVSSVLFFLGVLLAVDALHTAGILDELAISISHAIGNLHIIAVIIGLASAVIDNVPLVAATMGMYDLPHYPPDSSFWNLIAYCAGTGGSILVIGSAAGVAFMGMERIQFYWYFRRVGWAAAVGYFAGVVAFKLME